MKSVPKPAAPAIFTFNNTNAVRVETDADGTPWFCVADVCDVLGYSNSRDALARHCRAKGVVKRDTLTSKGKQGLAFIDEGNLYRLILKSRMPAAERFESWVCDEVLPALRKTGTYTTPKPEPKPQRAIERLNATDHANLRRVIWRVVDGMPWERRWVAAIWTSLRKAIGVPKGEMSVEHLPVLGAELRRALEVTEAARAAIDLVGETAKLVVLNGGDRRAAVAAIANALGEFNPKPDSAGMLAYNEREVQCLLGRQRPVCDHPEVDELAVVLAA